jgi:transcriptional regulator with XRE-family HTH domain
LFAIGYQPAWYSGNAEVIFLADEPIPIGLQIQRKRESLGITKSELADRAGVTPSIITRAEQLVSTPRGETLTKIEDALGLPAGTLSESRSRSEDVEIGTNIRFGFLYSINSGPFIMLAKNGSVPGVSFTSFAEEVSGRLRPKYYHPLSERKEPPEEIERDHIYPYVTTNLRDLLDREQLDVIFGWSGTTDSQSEYKSYAEVSVALTGLTCLYITRKATGELDREQLMQLKLKDIPMFYPRDHHSAVSRFIKASNESNSSLKYPVEFVEPYPVYDIDWNNTVSLVRKQLEDKGSVAYFGWDPFLRWMEQAFENDYGIHRSVPVGLLSANNYEWPIFSRMDIIVRANNARALKWLDDERRKNDGFFTELQRAVRRLKSDILEFNKNTDVPALSAVKEVADFLFMEPLEDANRSLRKAEYGVRYYE